MNSRLILTVSLLIVTASALPSCSTDTQGSASPEMSTQVDVTTTSRTPATTDRVICGDLENVGKTFYSDTYAPMMKGGGAAMNVQPITLTAQLAVLTTVGAEPGEIDGTAAISEASPKVRKEVFGMVKDADRLAQHFADVAKGGLGANGDLTAILTSFTGALVACAEAGYSPSWFKPGELTR